MDPIAAALVSLAESNIPTDIQELLVRGDPMRGIAPDALKKAILAAMNHLMPVYGSKPADD